MASGKSEQKFAEIDAFIANKNYNQALVLLEDLLKRDPMEFDNAQLRIRQILEMRTEFNDLAQILIDVIAVDPMNSQEKIKLLDELTALETNLDEQTRVFLQQTRRIAEFTFVRASFEKTMRTATALIEKDRYVDAVKRISESFSLNREELSRYDLKPEKIDEIDQKIKNLSATIEGYAALQKQTMTSVAKFNAAIKQNRIELAQTIFEQEVVPDLTRFANVCHQVASTGSYFYTNYNSLSQQYPNVDQNSYLYLMYQFTVGRNNDISSGILGTMENQWLSLTNSMKSTVAVSLESKWTRIKKTMDEKGLFTFPGTHSVAQKLLPEAEKVAKIGTQVNTLNDLRKHSYEGIIERSYPEYSIGMAAYETLAGVLFSHLPNIVSLSEIEKKKNEYVITGNIATNTPEKNTDFTKVLLQLTNSYRTVNSASSLLLKKVESIDAHYNTKSENDIPLQTAFSHEYVFSVIEQTILLEIASDKALWLAYGNYVSSGCNLFVSVYQNSLDKARQYYEGEKNATTGLISYYPAESYEEINDTLKKITAERTNLQNHLKTMNTTSVAVKSEAAYEKDIFIVEEAIKTLTKINAEGTELWAKARDKSVLATRAKSDGDLRYQQSRYNLQAGKFDESRKLLQQAREQYNKSLEIQESPSFRKSSDDLLSKLNTDINYAENEYVVREVRQLKNQAKQAYQAEDYAQAEQILLNAQERWFTTNIEADQEIVQILALIGTALSMKVGRSIPKTAPLYPEMSQLFNIANQYYDEGKKLANSGKKKEAAQTLQLAKQELRKMQVVYPVNQDASLLLLQIDQLLDPAAFDELFNQKFQQAKQNYSVPGKQQTAYLDLLDLYRINPRYPGLEALIYQVEIYLGVRVNPPDRTTQIRSENLTKQARTAVNSNDEIVLRSAIVQLDEAIRLDPSNEEALLLKDRLQIKAGGQALAVLSSTSEALYQKTVQELQNNNIINAAALLAQLLQDPNSRRSSKVLDLEKRIKILTGQG